MLEVSRRVLTCNKLLVVTVDFKSSIRNIVESDLSDKIREEILIERW